MPPLPHDAWAHVHDHVHRESFGEMLDNLTTATLALVERVCPTPCRVLDLGAGTGRIAVPLAQRGYAITAVEPSPAMLARLRVRFADERLDVATQCAAAQSFVPLAAADAGLALAVFTVMNYLLDEDVLRAMAARVAASLRPGGSFLFDLADRGLFVDTDYVTDTMRRRVSIAPANGDAAVFDYHEVCEGVCDGEPFAYTESLQMRAWSAHEVLPLLQAAGLELAEDHSDEMYGAGACYLRVRKG